MPTVTLGLGDPGAVALFHAAATEVLGRHLLINRQVAVITSSWAASDDQLVLHVALDPAPPEPTPMQLRDAVIWARRVPCPECGADPQAYCAGSGLIGADASHPGRTAASVILGQQRIRDGIGL